MNESEFSKQSNIELSFYSIKNKEYYQCQGFIFDKDSKLDNCLNKRLELAIKNIGIKTIAFLTLFKECVENSPKFLIEKSSDSHKFSLKPGEETKIALSASFNQDGFHKSLRDYDNTKTEFIIEAREEKQDVEASEEKSNAVTYQISARIEATPGGAKTWKNRYNPYENFDLKRKPNFSLPEPKKRKIEITPIDLTANTPFNLGGNSVIVLDDDTECSRTIHVEQFDQSCQINRIDQLTSLSCQELNSTDQQLSSSEYDEDKENREFAKSLFEFTKNYFS